MRALFYVAFLALLAATQAASYRRFVDYMIQGTNAEGFCEECEAVLQLLRSDTEGTLESALNACKETKYFTDRMCEAEYKVHGGTIAHILKHLTAPLSEVCKFLGKGACGEPTSELYTWDIRLDDIPDDSAFDYTCSPQHESEWKQTHLSMLHISDTHFDEDYDVGANADCNETVCCTKYQPQTTVLKNFAGPWGDPHGRSCNIPLRTVENMFQDIDRIRHVSFAIWTGDNSPHNLLGMSSQRAVKDIQETTNVIKHYLRNVKVFPAIGNHDAFPARMFPQPDVNSGNFSLRPLYEEMWNLWYEWIPADQERTFKSGGFYTAKIDNKLRIISLNTNFGYSSNWWLLLNANDPGKQLHWLIDTLQAARRNREKVFIIGHIPPGSEASTSSWENAYYKIVSKFNCTITGQFFAHLHGDSILLDYNDVKNPDTPTSVIYVTPAVTTSWSGMPEYRIYQTEMGEVVDVETYFLNLTTANAVYAKIRESVHDKVREDLKNVSPFRRRAMEKVLYGDPHWDLGYSARKSYGLRKFDAVHWGKLVKQLETDDNLLQTFYKHFRQFREDIDVQERPCDENCKSDLLKTLVTKRTLERRKAAQR